MPTMPTMPSKPKVSFPAATAPPVDPQTHVRSLHPAVQEHVAAWNETQKRLDQIQLENVQLRNDLEVERRHRRELEHQLDVSNKDCKYFMAYAAEISTHLEHIASSALAARKRALEATQTEQPAQDIDQIDPIEQNIAKIAKTFGAGKPNGGDQGESP